MKSRLAKEENDYQTSLLLKVDPSCWTRAYYFGFQQQLYLVKKEASHHSFTSLEATLVVSHCDLSSRSNTLLPSSHCRRPAKPMEVEDYGGTMSSVEVNHNGSNSGAQQSSSLSSKKRLDFSSTIERIVSTLEQRGDNHNPHHGPLNDSEISKLSMLCSQQTEHLRSINNHNKAKENYGSGTQSHILNDDLGFADVDADMMGELVEYLEKHVALASGIDLIQSSYRMIQTLKASSDGKQKKGQRDIDEVRTNTSKNEYYGTFVLLSFKDAKSPFVTTKLTHEYLI